MYEKYDGLFKRPRGLGPDMVTRIMELDHGRAKNLAPSSLLFACEKVLNEASLISKGAFCYIVFGKSKSKKDLISADWEYFDWMGWDVEGRWYCDSKFLQFAGFSVENRKCVRQSITTTSMYLSSAEALELILFALNRR
jgi:hypothetical protein